MTDKPYIEHKLTYTNDGRLVDENGKSVMMDWETPIMEKTAEVICRNGGRVLNVGFGMGIIDSFIEKYNIQEHWIIENHIDVYTKMLEDGWHLKKHVKILYGDWNWYFKYLPKFDGVFIDTWEESLDYFYKNASKVLTDNGIFSFFNNPRNDEHGLHMTEVDYQSCSEWGKIDFEKIELKEISHIFDQSPDGVYYWSPKWKNYYCPIITKK